MEAVMQRTKTKEEPEPVLRVHPLVHQQWRTMQSVEMLELQNLEYERRMAEMNRQEEERRQSEMREREREQEQENLRTEAARTRTEECVEQEQAWAVAPPIVRSTFGRDHEEQRQQGQGQEASGNGETVRRLYPTLSETEKSKYENDATLPCRVAHGRTRLSLSPLGRQVYDALLPAIQETGEDANVMLKGETVNEVWAQVRNAILEVKDLQVVDIHQKDVQNYDFNLLRQYIGSAIDSLISEDSPNEFILVLNYLSELEVYRLYDCRFIQYRLRQNGLRVHVVVLTQGISILRNNFQLQWTRVEDPDEQRRSIFRSPSSPSQEVLTNASWARNDNENVSFGGSRVVPDPQPAPSARAPPSTARAPPPTARAPLPLPRVVTSQPVSNAMMSGPRIPETDEELNRRLEALRSDAVVPPVPSTRQIEAETTADVQAEERQGGCFEKVLCTRRDQKLPEEGREEKTCWFTHYFCMGLIQIGECCCV